MSGVRKGPLGPWLVVPVLLLLGCGEGGIRLTGPIPGARVAVTGDVVEFQDLVPVDGGATITIKTPSGRTERLLFPSLFTNPPPSQQTIDLYDIVRRVEVGDRVWAAGMRSPAGIALEALAILGGGV